MMASTRATCKLDSDALAEVLKKFVTKTEWLLMPACYESPKTKRARIMNMAGVARAIVKVAENLNLQKKQAEKAVSLAFKKNQVNCDADAEGIKDAKLIRHNLRFIQQARSKSQGSDTWVEGLCSGEGTMEGLREGWHFCGCAQATGARARSRWWT